MIHYTPHTGYSKYLPVDIKEANWMFWRINGALIPDTWNKTDIINMYDKYFTDVWGNCDIPSDSENNFVTAWENQNGKQQDTNSIQSRS